MTQLQLPSLTTLQAWAHDLGFANLGVTDVDLSNHEPHVHEWLAQGFAGDMGYLQRNLEKRLHPQLLEEGTYRVITARMDYLAQDTQPIEVLNDSQAAYISRYALGRDYHKVLRKRLAKLAAKIDTALPGYQYRAFTDSAPVLEKALAEKSALGWIGKHTLLLNKEAGSWFFLGEIYTNAPLDVTAENYDNACGKCSACMTVCPTQAIIAPQTLDARRCISYLTIEHKGVIPEELRPLMGNRIYGCDDCQLFCPWNGDAPHTREPDFDVRHNLDHPSLIKLFELSEQAFLKLTEGSAMRRVGYEQWQRNIAIAMGNADWEQDLKPKVVGLLQQRLTAASAIVAEHIEWALKQIRLKV